MKKFIVITATIFLGIATYSQNYMYLNVTEIENFQVLSLCTNEYDGIVLQKDPDCTSWIHWRVTYELSGEEYHYSTDEITVTPLPNLGDDINVLYNDACEIIDKLFYIEFHSFNVSQPWSQEYIWKRTNDEITLMVTGGYNYQWSTGSTNWGINVTDPGTYWVRIYNDCGELYDTIEVRDNVEILLATCDLESNLNMVTWSTTEEQAEYVDHLNVKRDGMIVNTANYSDGVFIDNIGSDAAARTYTLVAVASDGTECPIESYQKETIHMSYVIGVNHTIEVGWNSPTGYELVGYNICEWNPNGKDGDLTIIDFVGAGVNTYTCSESQFDGGMVVVQGVEASKTENRLLSNRSKDYIGIDELTKQNLKIYPNPSDGTFTVEGTTRLTIYNILGQVITTSYDKDGIHKFTLNPGLYFVKSGEGMTKKVVVQ